MLEKKVYVLGDKRCGKSSLLLALTGIEPTANSPTCNHASSRRTTHVEVVTKLRKKRSRLCPCFSIGQPRLTTKEEKLVLNFFECEETETRVRAINYLDTDVILLCYDVSSHDSLVNLKEVWLPEVKYYCPDEVPILLTALKVDQKKQRERRESIVRRASAFFTGNKLDETQREARNLADNENIYSYIQCSAKDGRGLDQLKIVLSQAATTVTSRRNRTSSPISARNDP